MGLLGISLTAMLLLATAMGNELAEITDFEHHPMIQAAEESTATCPDDIDPNAHWMKKFLTLIKDKLPHQAVTWDELLPNLKHLADLDQKGYLAAIAKGDVDPASIEWPNPGLKPWIIPTYMPVVTPPQPEPVIVLEQVYNGKTIIKEVIEKTVRKKRDVNGEEFEEMEPGKRRAFRVDPNHFNDDLPYIADQPEHEIHEPEFDDDGQIIGRKKRDLPEHVMVWPPAGTLFTVKRLCVKASENGTIIFPDDE